MVAADPCSECGNSAVNARVYDGVSVLECELCGALGGNQAAVRAVLDARAARNAGVDPSVYGLVRAIGSLDGLRVCDHDGGDRGEKRLPSVSWQIVEVRAFVHLENLCKSLRLSARGLSLPWQIVAEYADTLTFALRPQPPARPLTEVDVAAAQRDLPALQRAFERDSRLSWWRHP